jgi:hypothetical protein
MMGVDRGGQYWMKEKKDGNRVKERSREKHFVFEDAR